MTDQEWSAVLASLRAAWSREDLPSQEILGVWRTWLEPHPLSRVLHCIQELAESGTPYRPEIGQIVKACKDAGKPPIPHFGEFYAELRGKVSGASWNSMPEDFQWSDSRFPGIARMIGWKAMMESHPEDAAFRAHVRRCYEDSMNDERDVATISGLLDDGPDYVDSPEWRAKGLPAASLIGYTESHE